MIYNNCLVKLNEKNIRSAVVEMDCVGWNLIKYVKRLVMVTILVS